MANDIKIGNNSIGGVYIGSSSVSSVYLGSNLVWTAFQGKWLATYTGGTTSSADCDSSSAISSSEITLTDLESVKIGDCVTSIGDFAFSYCTSLSSITIPYSVTSIGNNAFYNCSSLSSITIGSDITSIGINAFYGCSGLTSITVEATTPPTLASGAFDGSTCTIYVPYSSVNAYQAAWSDYASRIQAIPFQGKWLATYTGGTTSSADCDISSAITRNEVTNANLIEVEIGDCVTSIGTYAFYNCSGLTSCTIGSGVTSIGGNAFYNCSGLTSIDIPNSVTNIGSQSFLQCTSLTSINIPSGVTSIEFGCFISCTSLTSVTIPSGVTTINGSAFNNCSGLTSIDIPNSVTSIGNNAFYDCRSLSSITVNATTPPTITSNAFVNTNNCPIYVPSASVNAYKAAANWSTLASRIQAIPTPTPTGSTCYEVISTPITSYTSTTYDSVYSFDDVKWYMKNNLSQYEEYGVYDDSGSSLSGYTYYDGKLVAIGTTEYQRSGNTWVEVGTYVNTETTYTIDDTSPSPYVGQELSTTFKIPYNDVEEVGLLDFIISTSDGDLMITLTTDGYASYNYNNSYEGTVTNDGEYFYLSLPSEAPQSIIIQDISYGDLTPIHLIVGTKQVTVEYIEKVMPLTQVYSTVADMELVGCPTVGVGQYGVVGNSAYQFTNNEEWDAVSNVKLVAIYSGGSANVIGCNSSSELSSDETKPSYLNASTMTSAVIGDCVTSFGYEAFSGCTSLSSVTIPNSVTSIGSSVFNYCSGLTSVAIPNSVTSIGSSVFNYCSSLTSVTIPDSVTSIGQYAFANCSSLTSVTVNATTPPTLANTNAFTNTNNCPIYVPSESVEAYKAASNWSTYASRIQAIPSQ